MGRHGYGGVLFDENQVSARVVFLLKNYYTKV